MPDGCVLDVVNAYLRKKISLGPPEGDFILLAIARFERGNSHPPQSARHSQDRYRIFTLRVGPKADVDSKKVSSFAIATTSTERYRDDHGRLFFGNGRSVRRARC